MPLDNYGRGLLEKSIDETIPIIPTFVEDFEITFQEIL